MPKFLEQKLNREYAGLSKQKKDNIIYGTMNKIGAMHGNKITAKGRRMEAKHNAHMRAAKPKRSSAPTKLYSRLKTKI